MLTKDYYRRIDELNSSIERVMFSHLPPLNSLRVFDSAARLMSFKAAALELNVSPTAVSHQIRTLEERLGTLLFERKTRSIELTDEGEKLAAVAYQCLQQISGVLEAISDKQSLLTVSTTASFAAQWLVPKLDSFHRRHANIQVIIKTDEQLEDLQEDRRLDLVIRYGAFDEQCEHSTKLVTERFGMYATKPYLQKFPSMAKATLIETAWKSPNLHAISWQKYFKSTRDNNLTIRAYDQEHHVIQAALAGQGIALVSSLLVQTAVANGWLEPHPRGEFLEGFSYYMLCANHSNNSRKVRLFRQWLLDEFA